MDIIKELFQGNFSKLEYMPFPKEPTKNPENRLKKKKKKKKEIVPLLRPHMIAYEWNFKTLKTKEGPRNQERERRGRAIHKLSRIAMALDILTATSNAE